MSESVKRVITFEEHYICPEADAAYRRLVDQSRMSDTQRMKLASSEKWVQENPIADISARRIQWMEANGVDMQVLSYGDNSPADLPADEAIPLCRLANDYLAERCKAHPDRFAGFAVLPVDAPDEAAKEAERAVLELGLKGVSFKATFRGEEFFDGRRFAPIFEAVGALNVPITFHPNDTVPAVTRSYYEGDAISPIASMLLSGFGIGWHYETGVAYLRLVVSGLLDRYPDMKLTIGHWGEVLPYYFDRLDMAFVNLGKGLLQRNIADYFRQNMYVMPSGLQDKTVMDTPMKVCLDAFGPDHIIWSNDYRHRAGRAEEILRRGQARHRLWRRLL